MAEDTCWCGGVVDEQGICEWDPWVLAAKEIGKRMQKYLETPIDPDDVALLMGRNANR